MSDDETSTIQMLYSQTQSMMVDYWRRAEEERRDRPPEAYEITAMKKRGVVTVCVCDQGQYDGGPFDFGASYEAGSLPRVLKSLEAIRDTIPEKYRAKARCGIDSTSGYEGSHYAHIVVSYDRPETDDEWAARKADVQRRLDLATARQEEADRKAFERLKAKFGA